MVKKVKKAFSLIELAVVLVVIGVLTIAITKGSSLIKSARISSAQSLTASAKIHEIEGLTAWYETVLPDSLDKVDKIHNEPVAYWQDVSSQYNISQSLQRLIRTESSSVVYTDDGIGGLPSIQFTASGNFTLSNLQEGASNLASVFVVISPTLSFGGSTMTFLDSYDTGDNALSLTNSTFSIESASTNTVSYAFSEGEEYVIGVNLKGTSDVYVNNVDATGTAAVTVNGFNGLTVGTDRGASDNFTGLISEIIIFNRILTESERRHVMSYLGKKYKIRVEGAAI